MTAPATGDESAPGRGRDRKRTDQGSLDIHSQPWKGWNAGDRAQGSAAPYPGARPDSRLRLQRLASFRLDPRHLCVSAARGPACNTTAPLITANSNGEPLRAAFVPGKTDGRACQTWRAKARARQHGAGEECSEQGTWQ
ncbi:hypothetical protein SKAU_G00327980 [Synaphobranchus kaupii]|uniref:Uncharacterized protein n=1 Tax=Synaphobranchus kaupii TaxID=118154 RepID=A0A9Q1IJH8_SYNKA|nr:hypothetical protein SKAU_G00327980 [Synaphobranchus kaupii]